VQWPLLRIFLGLAAMTALGIVHAFLLDASRPISESAVIAFFWSWYNLLVLILACYVCIEQRRSSVRFATDEIVRVQFANYEKAFAAVDISMSGIRLAGRSPAAVGTWVWVCLKGFAIRARVVRVARNGFALQFEQTLQNRMRLTQHIFSGQYSASVRSIRPSSVMFALAHRIFR
jgi:cellulose synthase (UDP-forming)